MLALVGLHRLGYLIAAVVVGMTASDRGAASDLVLLVAVTAGTAAMMTDAVRSGRFRPAAVTADVLVTSFLLLAASTQPSGPAHSPKALWLAGAAQSGAVLVGAAVRHLPSTLVTLPILLAAQASAIASDGGEIATALGSLLLLAAVAAVLTRGANHSPLPPGEPPADGVRGAAETRARYQRVLHDGALATLTAIARGSLDHRTTQVRHRCARDADRIRRLLSGETDPDSEAFSHDAELPHALQEAADSAEALGLRVHLRILDMPDHVPPRLTDALCGAVGEALSNVQRHAGTGEAWVTAVGSAGRLRVTVVDRGVGFDSGTRYRGWGLRDSIVARLRENGGRAEIYSQLRAGTCVELSWPR